MLPTGPGAPRSSTTPAGSAPTTSATLTEESTTMSSTTRTAGGWARDQISTCPSHADEVDDEGAGKKFTLASADFGSSGDGTRGKWQERQVCVEGRKSGVSRRKEHRIHGNDDGSPTRVSVDSTVSMVTKTWHLDQKSVFIFLPLSSINVLDLASR